VNDSDLLELESRDREDKNFVFTSLLVHLYIITKVLFIGHKEGSERTKVIKLHSLVGVIGKRKRYGHPQFILFITLPLGCPSTMCLVKTLLEKKPNGKKF
jgi:hypothetical protein